MTANKFQMPAEALKDIVFRVSVDEDGDAYAVATVMITDKEWKIIVGHVEEWDDGSEGSCGSAFFKRKAQEGEMVFVEGERPRTLVGIKRGD